MKTTINKFCQFLALSVLVVAWLGMDAAFAQALPNFTPVYTPAVSGNVTTFGPTWVNSANASRFTFGPAANGSVYGSVTQSVGIGGGRVANVVVKAPITKAAVARTVTSAIAKGAIRGGPYLAAGMAGYELYQYLKSQGFETAPDPAGGPDNILEKFTDGCSPYKYYTQYGGGVGCSPELACKSIGGTAHFNDPPYDGTCDAPGKNFGRNYTRQDSTPTEGYRPVDIPQLEEKLSNRPPENAPNMDPAIKEAVKLGGDPLPTQNPTSVTGPTSVPMPPTVTTNPDGSTTTREAQKDITYGPDSVTVTDKETTTSKNPAGEPTSTSTTTKPAEVPQVEVCGLPGKPKCLIDETGTPDVVESTKYDGKLEPYQSDRQTKRDTIGGGGDKPFFQGWSIFFNAPPLAQCEPITLPEFKGASMGSVNPCGVVEGTRTVMGYIWAIAGLLLCLGMVRKVV